MYTTAQTDLFISVFILCGSVDDVVSIKEKAGKIDEDIMFILIDIYK